MTNTLLMIIEPAVRQAEVARLEQERYRAWAMANTRPMPEGTYIELQAAPAKPEPSISPMTYALVHLTINGTGLLALYVLYVLVQQLMGVRPLW